MSAHTAFRVAARPLRQVAAAAAPRPASQLQFTPPLCLRCSIDAGAAAAAYNRRAAPTRARLFSTAPPPPRQPLPPSPEDHSRTPGPESTVPEDAAAASTPSPTPQPSPDLPPHSEPEAAPSAAESSPAEPSSPDPASAPSQTADPSAPPRSSDPPDSSLPSFTETHRHPLSARFSTFMDNLQARALTATQKLNDLTGYSAIEAIKARNTELEQELAAAQERLRAARHAYKSLTAHRAATQREVTTLLARKDTWNPADLERFTTLYRSDHTLEADVAAAAAELTDAETDEARLSAALTAGILKRYHEEQIWSDRIRRQSTWGTWGLMGVNVVLFLVLQFVAEPWRRKRLMKGIAEREEGVMDEVRRELEEVRAALAASRLHERQAAEPGASTAAEEPLAVEGHGTGPAPGTSSLGVTAEQVPRKPWKEVLLDYWEDPKRFQADVLDLYSERKIDLRMRDASLIALQGAAAGATIAGALALALLRSTST
ncbi:896e9547-af9a-47ff-a2f8-a602112b3fa7 [Thermothielavioides terrestris]|uniref:Sensitive to high expression protein 9, mitochondrial n=2 Tax=Thermothielavioides terrestris TaxID=2587410 RepID=G2QZ71_THETT|nr:uncharacterized protein THITE_2114323 [Thermothielavioides terrestris NRRL 8126]AEO66307.1 hypothetical protein THITE_2114323 [Thermothielavioides terrestris NRRL 8126]SPQ25417.1 896e9547-af9a-47ff-a2f8-a602112b3fa7 [Thermothielavioides terrestris]